jgi:shikimate dehydrogenase
MHNAAFGAAGIDASYEAIEAPLHAADAVMSRLRKEGYAGWNVTTPLKEAVLTLVDHVSAEAARAHAINTVRAEPDGSLSGHNTDGAGLIAALRDLWSWDAQGQSVLVLGTGPAARACAAALVGAGAATLSCWSRDQNRAAQIGPPPASAVDLVVCALAPNAALPASVVEVANAQTLIFDCNYGREESAVAAMRARRRSDGLPLLLHQGALSFTWWTGKSAPLAVMRATLGMSAGA